MRIKNILKSGAILCLLVIVATSFIGCNHKVEPKEPGNLPNQVKNDRYYFQQGYLNEWSATYDPDERALDNKTLLLIEMWPTEAQGSAVYNIYNGDTGLITATVKGTAEKVINSQGSLYLNTRFIKNETPRENFAIKNADTEDVMHTEIYNKIQYMKVSYTFTQDGTEWVGDAYITMKGTEYFLITWERKASVGDTYQSQFVQIISDFRYRGFEEDV